MSVDKGKIYKITNTINGLVYIGCTVNSLKKRFYEHIYRCEKTDYKSKLYNAIKKYGIDNFKIELVEECDLSCIYENEKKYIDLYDSYHNGLNSTFGGEGCIGYKHSPEIRKKISMSTKNGNSHKGKTYEELYGDRAVEERENRKKTVQKKWDTITIEQKELRVSKMIDSVQKKSKYGIELVKEIKTKINEGKTVKELKELYPQIKRDGFFYELKNGKRWSNI